MVARAGTIDSLLKASNLVFTEEPTKVEMTVKQTKFKQPLSTPIHGVVIQSLKVVPDERGRLMEIMRKDDPLFTGFGQVYLSTVFIQGLSRHGTIIGFRTIDSPVSGHGESRHLR